ncbi:unnamed protein product [Onchocerca flexuosa]|uniref:Uncharacterized protein n=1 Tax=Onchocerca flexuosa TaxID=387005 RepID=A0A183I3G1_9BILA|nr:unnamed protein product [Onchocerca flexuosa]
MSLPMKVPTPTPPVKGSFPLDHEGQCRYEMLKYMLCLNEHKDLLKGFKFAISILLLLMERRFSNK